MTLCVNVLMGGPSVEHEVSLNSGLEVMRHLDPKAYGVHAVVVSQEKYFFTCDFAKGNLTKGDLANPPASGKFKGPFIPSASRPLWETCDVAFLALHGTFGEDGVIQGFLDTIGVPYTGSGVCASAIAMEKIATKFLYLNHGLSVPPWSVYGKAFPGVTIDALEKKHGFPCFVKCPQSGSSRLMGRAGDRPGLIALISEFERHADRLLVESAINGIEFSCGILENDAGAPYALPPIEIRPVHGTYFDYTAKYTTGESEEIVPAPRPRDLLEKIKATALHAHMILGCRGVSRTDMIYADDRLYVLETNTLPGMTPNSLLPKAFVAAGGTYGGLLDTLIRSALIRKASTIA